MRAVARGGVEVLGAEETEWHYDQAWSAPKGLLAGGQMVGSYMLCSYFYFIF